MKEIFFFLTLTIGGVDLLGDTQRGVRRVQDVARRSPAQSTQPGGSREHGIGDCFTLFYFVYSKACCFFCISHHPDCIVFHKAKRLFRYVSPIKIAFSNLKRVVRTAVIFFCKLPDTTIPCSNEHGSFPRCHYFDHISAPTNTHSIWHIY